MKASRGWTVAGAMAIMAGFAAGGAWAQGPLNPPGPPLASMKTLAQIHAQAVLAEPRTALSAENTPGQSNYVYAVTNPGSYYLTGNLTATNGGILVLADDVTLDLGGFRIEGDPALKHYGVMLYGNNVEIRGGTVARFGLWGIGYGGGSFGGNCRMVDLRLINNTDGGVLLNDHGHVARCTVVSNLGYGISVDDACMIEDNVASYNGSEGIETSMNCLIRGNTARYNGADGIEVYEGCSVEGNVVAYNTQAGIWSSNNSSVRDNVAYRNNQGALTNRGGIYVPIGCNVVGNTLTDNQVNGIYVYNYDTVVENNFICGSPTGIHFRVSGSLYVNNRFSDCATPVGGTATDGGGNLSF